MASIAWKASYPLVVGKRIMPQAKHFLPVIDRFSNKEFTRVALAGKDDIESALALAAAAAPAMAKTGAFQRKDALLHVADRLAKDQSLFAQTIAREAGKPIADATGEVARAIDTVC
jgi:acyl-CoA reductase-like NAD-dependent aldehyde dehydrogenase